MKFLRDFKAGKEDDKNRANELTSALVRDIVPKLENCKELYRENQFRRFFMQLGAMFGGEKVIVKINNMKYAIIYHKTYCIAKNINLSSNFFRE